jgi:hypothetical protein
VSTNTLAHEAHDYSESPERIIIDDDDLVSSVTSDSNYLINFSLKFFTIKILIDDPERGFHGGSSKNKN